MGFGGGCVKSGGGCVKLGGGCVNWGGAFVFFKRLNSGAYKQEVLIVGGCLYSVIYGILKKCVATPCTSHRTVSNLHSSLQLPQG